MRPPRTWLPSRERLQASPWLRWLRPFLDRPHLWHWSRRGVALGVALGVFFGLLIPIAQIPLSAAAAIVLRANVPAAAASTLVTNPVTFGPVYYGAYRLGLWLTGETVPSGLPAVSAPPEETGLWSRLTRLGRPLLLGLSIVASLSGLLTYVLITLLWRWRVMAKRRKRAKR